MSATVINAYDVLKKLCSQKIMSGEYTYSVECALMMLARRLYGSPMVDLLTGRSVANRPYEECSRLEGQLRSAVKLHKKRNGSLMDHPFPVRDWLVRHGVDTDMGCYPY